MPRKNRPGIRGADSLRVASILFLDVKNFSKLNHHQLERFIDEVMPELARLIDPFRANLLELNTWGDAIVAVSDDPVHVAKMALEIRDYFQKTNFDAKGLPRNLLSRISLHVGTVKVGYDPIRKRRGVIGANVNLAARIEPVILPGEVWVTKEFERILQPHVAAERLAFDDLGSKDLAKDYGNHHLLRLRRESEASTLSSAAEGAMKAARKRSHLTKAFDVIGIGALNTDYIATAASLRKIKPDLIAEHEKLFELGKERVGEISELRKTIAEIGKSQLAISLGGSAFNTLHVLARAVPELNLGYVGVAGKSEAETGFVERLTELNVDCSCVRSVEEQSGICISYITRGERSLLTSAGANTLLAEHLRQNRSEIIKMLGRARLVHVTSLFDAVSPPLLAAILREAKDQNPWLQVSFDPGHDWVRRIKTADASDAIHEIMGFSSYLFLNQAEFELLASDLGIKDDQDLARDIFEDLSSQTVLILLKYYNEIRVYHRLHRKLKEIRFLNSPLPPNQVEDATGAGDVFAAGLFAAIMVPGLELRDGVEIGLRLVRKKLLSPGASDYSSFSGIVEDYVDTKYAHADRAD